MVKALSLLMATAEAFNTNQWWTGGRAQPPQPKKPQPGQPLWLPWGAWSSCRGVCGSGVSNRLRRCLNGVAGVDCQGDSLDSRSCDNPVDDTCSYWSGWGQWEAWGCETKPGTRLKRVKTRTCFGRSTDQCVGSTTIEEFEDAPLRSYCQQTNTATCCRSGDEGCNEEICFTEGQCQDRVQTSRRTIPLPCCDEFDTWTSWSSVTPSCVEQQSFRSRSNKCTGAVETESRAIPAIDGVFSAWEVLVECDGQQLTYGNNQIWQCAGKRVLRRTHTCYSEGVHTTDRYGNPLEFSRTEPCGTDAAPQWTQWSKNDAECAAVCANTGVVRTRALYDYCKQTMVECDANNPDCRQNCGKIGDWHLWSAWSSCSNDCGGVETRFRKHECGVYQDEVQSRPCGQSDGWSAYGPYDGVCPTTYPDACADTFISRVRTSRCGVMNQLTGQLEYNQVDTAQCDKPPMTYNEVVGQCSSDCHDMINGVYSFRVIQTFDACGNLVNEKKEQCNVEPCCAFLEWSAWSSCSCAGQATRSRANVCKNSYMQQNLPRIQDQVETKACQVPTLPMRQWSDWTVCTGNCPTPSMRYRCPVCAEENSDSQCINPFTQMPQTAEYESMPCDPVTQYTCDQCIGQCGQGQKKCYQQDLCTLSIVPGTETMVNCDDEIPVEIPPPAVRGPCAHNYNNPLCPGIATITQPATQCYQGSSWTEPCGPAVNPPDTVSEWTPCDVNCEQTRTISNPCTGLYRQEVQACRPNVERQWSPPSQCVGAPGAPTFWYNNEYMPCSGVRTQVLRPVCPTDIIEEKFIPCGLEYELDTYDNLNSETCLDTNLPHYIDCEKDDQGKCVFPQTNLSCELKIFQQTVSIVRQPRCPKWAPVECSRTDILDPKICDKCMDSTFGFGEWSRCSEECKQGYMMREELENCPNQFLPQEGPFSRPTGRREVAACGPTPQSKITEGECLNKSIMPGSAGCSYCSNTRFGTKTVTTYAFIPGSPQCGEQVTKVEEVPCALPECPSWSEQIFPACDMCDTSVSRTRVCNKPLGAEMCDCVETPFVSVQACPVTITWSEWSQFDACSKSCGGGEKTRTRYNLCDMNQIETNTVTCNEDPGTFIDTNQRTPCSSSRCVTGYNNAILTHTCLKDANNNFITQYGQTEICFTPGDIQTTRTAVGGCMISPNQPAAACQTGLQVYVVKNECSDLAGSYPEFGDKQEYEYCTVPPMAPSEWTQWSACTKQCVNAGEPQEITTRQRFDECGKPEIEQQMCNVATCAAWSGWEVEAKCSCNNPGAAVVRRRCIDGNGLPAVGCAGDSRFQIPCGQYTSAAVVNPGSYNLPQVSPAQLAEIKALMLDVGSWAQKESAWSAFSGCAKQCDVSGLCGDEYRTRDAYCEDSDGNIKNYLQITDSRPCPCETGNWVVVADTCSSPDPMSCSGIRTVTKQHTCTGDKIDEVAGSCGTPGTWGAWSTFTQCRTQCLQEATPTRSRTRSWTCAAERASGMYNDEVETVACPTVPCAYFGAWSSWSACTVSCGMGTKTRTRYCHGGEIGSGLCVGDANSVLGDETVQCDMGDCCEWDWSGWTGCCRGDNGNKRLRLRGNNCGQDVEQIEKPCENDITNPGATYASCSVIRQTGISQVRQGASLTLFQYAQTGKVQMTNEQLTFINPDKVQNVVYQDFKRVEDPMTHKVISDAQIVNANVQQAPKVIAQAPQAPVMINQTFQPAAVQQAAVPAFQPVVQQQQPMVQQKVVVEPKKEESSPNTNPFGPFGFLFSEN